MTKKMFNWIELAVLEINNIIALSALRDNYIFLLITIKKPNRSGRFKNLKNKILLEFYQVQFFSFKWKKVSFIKMHFSFMSVKFFYI